MRSGHAFYAHQLFNPTCIRLKAYQMPNKPHQLFAILEAPLAHIQPLYASAYKLLRVERRVPRLDEQRAEDDFEDVGAGRGFLRWLQGRRGGRRGHGGYIGGHWAGDDASRGRRHMRVGKRRAWAGLSHEVSATRGHVVGGDLSFTQLTCWSLEPRVSRMACILKYRDSHGLNGS